MRRFVNLGEGLPFLFRQCIIQSSWLGFHLYLPKPEASLPSMSASFIYKKKPANLISWLSKHASFSSSGCFVFFFPGSGLEQKEHEAARRCAKWKKKHHVQHFFTDDRIVESQPKNGRKGIILVGVPVVPFLRILFTMKTSTLCITLCWSDHERHSPIEKPTFSPKKNRKCQHWFEDVYIYIYI